MKNIYISYFLIAMLLIVSSCDKNFKEINTSPVLSTTLDPAFQFSNAQQASAILSYFYPGQIVQQINTPFGGVLEGGNRNTVNDGNSNRTFNSLYTGPIRSLTDIINNLKDNPNRVNLFNMARIWRAYCFQILVDTYGDVPYSEAGRGFIDHINLPKYDDQEVIYEDILKEYQEATDGLVIGKDLVSGDLFFKGDITKWKRLGNSLLLRAGMRYTKIDEGKAKSIVNIALDPSRGGVMISNDNNAFIQFNAIQTNSTSSTLLGGERANYYIGKPFIDFLKTTNDPRLPYISVKYENPSNPLGTAGAADTDPTHQDGMPYGYDENSIATAPAFPGKNGSAFNYSQFNRATVLRIDAPEFLVSYAQTQLLLAEAAVRGYITTNAPKDYYEAGVKGHMTEKAFFGETLSITSQQQDAFLRQAEVALDSEPARALEQINNQYWVASLRNWGEAWANFRRSGYPRLLPINYMGEDPSVNTGDADGFIHRLPYPLREKSANTANVEAATAHMGGDNLGIRVFWDKK